MCETRLRSCSRPGVQYKLKDRRATTEYKDSQRNKTSTRGMRGVLSEAILVTRQRANKLVPATG